MSEQVASRESVPTADSGALTGEAAGGRASVWRLMDNAGKAIGLIAGLVGVGYAVGGLVVALRMMFNEFFPDDAVVLIGQLPREFVVTTGFVPLAIAVVLGGTVWIVVVRPAIGDSQRPAASSDPGKRTRWRDDPWSRRLLGVADVGLSVVFAGAMAILVVSRYAFWPSAPLAAVGVLVAAMVLFGQNAALSSRNLLVQSAGGELRLVTALATIALATPGAILLVSQSGFKEARVCIAGSAEMRGMLLAHTNDRVLLAQRSAGGEAKAIVALPAARVERVEVGDMSLATACPTHVARRDRTSTLGGAPRFARHSG